MSRLVHRLIDKLSFTSDLFRVCCIRPCSFPVILYFPLFSLHLRRIIFFITPFFSFGLSIFILSFYFKPFLLHNPSYFILINFNSFFLTICFSFIFILSLTWFCLFCFACFYLLWFYFVLLSLFHSLLLQIPPLILLLLSAFPVAKGEFYRRFHCSKATTF